MKKRFASLLLCALIILSGVLSSGCSIASSGDTAGTTGEGEEAVTTRSNMTLSLWIPTDDSTTAEAIQDVEIAINSITQVEFDTAIKLYAIPDSEYDEVIKGRIELLEERKKAEEQAELDRLQQQLQAAQKGEEYIEETTVNTENPNMDGDYSLVVRNAAGYDNVGKNQLDIFLIRGAEDYTYYASNFFLEDLRSEITGSSKELATYIYPNFFDAAVYDNGIYGVPNNHVIGEYTYFLVNKDLVEAEYLDPTRLTSLQDCQEFIEAVAKYHTDYVPVYGNYSPSYYHYWNGSQDADKFSVLASRVLYSSKPENVTFDNIFEVPNFYNNYYLYKLFKEKGYVNTAETVPAKFGVGYITCTKDEIAKYENDYYVTAFEYPEGTDDDYLQSVFAVSKFTKNTSRAMEIITLLNTSTELRTVLQYGVEGQHWKYDEEDDSIIVKLSDDYKMDIVDTGNVYMTYPDYGVSLDSWDNAKVQNTQSYYPPTLDFGNPYSDLNTELFKELDALSARLLKEIEAMTADEFKASVARLAAEVNNSDCFKKLTYMPADTDERNGRTEAKGWYANASLPYLWQEYCISIYGEDFLNW
ncbi:MAG: hypothetical protein E7575_00330 [Ruminococcaceae bacterium]|nr:hypothetical protein [Oscillospiraceae bacterium]